MPPKIVAHRHQSTDTDVQTSQHHAREQNLDAAKTPERGDIARRIKEAAHSNTTIQAKAEPAHAPGLEALIKKHCEGRESLTNRDVINALYREFGPTSRNTYVQAERRFGIDIDTLAQHREAPFHFTTSSSKAAHSQSSNAESTTTTHPTSHSSSHADPSTHSITGLPGIPHDGFERVHLDRGRFRAELQRNPELRVELTKLAVKEVGGDNPTLTVAFYESLFNRATREGLTIQQALHNGYYGPINRNSVNGVPTDTPDYAGAENGLVTALQGTNVIEGRLHQDGREWYVRKMGGDPSTFLRIGGEIFYRKFGEREKA
jgi:hypothetical protein